MTADPVPPAPTPTQSMRSAEELEHFLVWLPTSWYANPKGVTGQDYLTGVRNSVEWVLGRQRESPIRCQRSDGPVTSSDVHHEHRSAHEAMRDGADHVRHEYRLRPQDTMVFSLQYFTGVEHTLYWVLGHGGISLPEDWPWPAEFR